MPSNDYSERQLQTIAKVCYEAKRAYCSTLGDNSQVPWDDATEESKQSYLMGVKLRLDYPDAGPEIAHAGWMKQKLREGWVYGPIKDENTKEHPCLVSFADLPKEQQAKVFIITAIVYALA
jgi:hypothetical protein